MRKTAHLIVMVALCVLLSGCSSGLSRSKAGSLIDAALQKTDVNGTFDVDIPGLIRDGYCDQGCWHYLGEAAKHFSAGFGNTVLTPPLHRQVVAITGIADGDTPKTTKIVTFTWKLRDVSPFVLKYWKKSADIHSGKAELKLYDDGWRVEGMACGPNEAC